MNLSVDWENCLDQVTSNNWVIFFKEICFFPKKIELKMFQVIKKWFTVQVEL